MSRNPTRSFGSPLLPQTAARSRQPSIRSPSHSHHPNGNYQSMNNYSSSRKPRSGRFACLLVGALVLAVILWSFRDGGTHPSSSGAEDLSECKAFPWMARCGSGMNAAEKNAAVKGPVDPFDGLKFDRKGGQLFYPAHAVGDPDTIPPNQPHPIHLLIRKAKEAWDKKLARQSKTLDEAVAEYERRHKMKPPRGFPEWFAFASEHGFVLVDEFDALHKNILPYLSLSPQLLRQRSEKLQNDKEFWIQDKTFTLEIRKGEKARAVGPMSNAENRRADQMLQLLEQVVQRLPDMNITFTGHDIPWIGLSGEARAQMVAKAKAGQYMDDAKADDYQDNWDFDGWASICPVGSPLRAAKRFDDRAEIWSPPPPSFIYNHVASMDLCIHPDSQTIHGFTAWPGPRAGLLYPIFSFTGTTMHSDFLAPPIDQYDVPVGYDPPWEEKTVNKVIWRGTTTGADLNIAHMRKWSQRPRLCGLARQPGTLTLQLALNDTPEKLGPTDTTTTSAVLLASAYFDFKFLGKPQQCDNEVACAEFEKQHSWDKWMDQEDQNLYKYIIDVDGNGWSGRFHRLMSSSSMVLKSTIFPEWYQDHIQTWLHYVPVAVDYTDLWPIMSFFHGNKDGEGAHDDLAKAIGLQGQEWAAKHWRWEDMQVYFYRLLIEYDRIMNRLDDDPRSMDM